MISPEVPETMAYFGSMGGLKGHEPGDDAAAGCEGTNEREDGPECCWEGDVPNGVGGVPNNDAEPDSEGEAADRGFGWIVKFETVAELGVCWK